MERFEYFALINERRSPGVLKKIESTIRTAKQIGFVSNCSIFPTNFCGVWQFFNALLSTRSEYIVIRFSDLVSPIVFLITLILRFKGRKIIIDVPTPRRVIAHEISLSTRNSFKRILRQLASYASASWVLLPAHLVIQYSEESKWFSFGVKHKTLKIGNGILIDDDLPVTRATWPSQELNLIAVAQLSEWHGYDRMLRALAQLERISLGYRINFTIVGDGEVLQSLKQLSNELKLTNVVFTGWRHGSDLDREFLRAHIGISSLGLYRVGLDEASVLKTREYLARGLYVMSAGDDPDFVNLNTEFRYKVSNDGDIEDIISFFKQVSEGKLDFFHPHKCREFAEEKLSFKQKLKTILRALDVRVDEA